MTRYMVDSHGVVHVNVRYIDRTQCGREFTLSQSYAKDWPSSVIVEHMDWLMDRDAPVPTCVRCLGASA